MIGLEISQDVSPSSCTWPGEFRRWSGYFSPGHLRRALLDINPGSQGQTQMHEIGEQRKVGGWACR